MVTNLRLMTTDPTYHKLSRTLYRTRMSLHKGCQTADVDAEYIDIDLLEVKCCDWCGFWDRPNKMTIEPDTTVYCQACVDSDYL